MNSDVPEITKTISRRQYVQEKLFNQMFNELCSRQYVHRDAIEPNTEYSDKIGGKSCVGIEQQKMSSSKFKLYGEHSNAISFWNTAIFNGRGHFKQYHPLTKLNIERLDEQWS